MFSILQIRAKARQTIAETPGAYLLALIPIILNIIIQLIASAQSNSWALQLASNPTPDLSFLISSSAFPFLYGILADLMTLSISLALFQVIYHYRDSVNFKDSFTLFSHQQFGSILATYLLKSLFLFLWGLISVIGFSIMFGGLIVAFMAAIFNQPSEDIVAVAGTLILIGLLIGIAGIALLLPQVYAYFLVEPLLFDQLAQDTYTGPFAVIKESRRLMKGYKMKGFILNLSFIGWEILVALSFGIVGIYVIPYYCASHMHFYQAVLDDRAMKEKLFQGTMP
ncbi:DUF975 family protein [Streptococcus acidominimus]|uniref:Integral membrane protein n=1 Tax=Streptococcus acidominimus TaxID=1326 RepID=A0A1Q8EC11_STRAI|nr:DUF975 family protein [Streptococcus acidominimus]OLF49325.1 hypothetical protein BU200_07965 [Streptococcus acidominimus]SUN07361.1 integral membrane protein [Streptococcus acidominimus]